MKKIVFISSVFSSVMEVQRMYELFTRNEFEIELWEASGLFNIIEWVEINAKCKHIRIRTNYQLCSLIIRQKIRNTVFIYFNDGGDTFNLSQILISILNGKYCVVDFGSTNTSRTNILMEKHIKNKQKNVMDFFSPVYSFLGSRHTVTSMKSHYQISNGNNVYVHTRDFDDYIRVLQHKNTEMDILSEPYILMIDQNFFDHPDQVNWGTSEKWIHNEELFIKEIHKFLDEIENIFSMKVVIAAHPRKAKRIEELYNGRKIIYGNTAGYIKDAEFVIACCSGAIGYAVLFRKKILMYTNDQIKRSSFYLEYQLPKARLLNVSNIVNISRNIEKIRFEDCMTDPSQYDEYTEYMTDDIESREFVLDIVLKYIKKI